MRQLLEWLGWSKPQRTATSVNAPAESTLSFAKLNAGCGLTAAIDAAIADAVADCRQRSHVTHCRVVAMELHIPPDDRGATCRISVQLHRPVDARLN